MNEQINEQIAVEITDESLEREYRRETNKKLIRRVMADSLRQKLTQAYALLEEVRKSELDTAPRDRLLGAQVDIANVYSDFQLSDSYYKDIIENWSVNKEKKLGVIKYDRKQYLEANKIKYEDKSTIKEVVRQNPGEKK